MSGCWMSPGRFGTVDNSGIYQALCHHPIASSAQATKRAMLVLHVPQASSAMDAKATETAGYVAILYRALGTPVDLIQIRLGCMMQHC